MRIPVDDFHQRILFGNYVNTITTEAPRPCFRCRETKIIDVYAKQDYRSGKSYFPPYAKIIEQHKRVYGKSGLCPTLHTCLGGFTTITNIFEIYERT